MSSWLTDHRRLLMGATMVGLALAGSAPARTQRAAKPNIIFIMADDMGYADLSSYGAQGYRTPVLDGLAAQGARLDQAYANSAICSPTRTALVTGRYQYRFNAGLAEPNIKFKPGDELPLNTPTIASVLKQNGYRTALVGKWHVTQVNKFSPLKYGYDSFFGIAAGAADYFRHGHVTGDNDGEGLYDGEKPVRRDGYLTDILADEAIRQIKAGGNKPLFMSLHFNAPHWPWEGPEDRAHSTALKSMRDPYGGSLETYAKMVQSMDANIGRVLAALDAQGMTRDTIVIFTSDNGGERFSNNWPLVGYKGELLEGGIRVPMIIRWPGHIKPGTLSHQVAISMDMMPTFIAAAGGKAPTNMDGMNILPQLTGAQPETTRTLYWRYNAASQQAVREGDWKYLKTGSKEALFNVRTDPRERNDMQDRKPEMLALLKAKWAEWNKDMLPYPAGGSSEGTIRFYSDRYLPGGAPRPAPAGGQNRRGAEE